MRQQEGFEVRGKENSVCKLKKSIWAEAVIEDVVPEF